MALSDGLFALWETQREVGAAIPGWVEGEPEYVRTTFLALVCELMELLQLFNWKQWKRLVPFDVDKAADEFADVLAFLGYIVIFLGREGITTRDLSVAYQRKTEVNHGRLAGKVKGYGFENERCAKVPWDAAAGPDGDGPPDASGYRQRRMFPKEVE